MTKDPWKEKLTPEQFRVLREKGTEAPYTGKYLKTKDQGVYVCGACGADLFNHTQKFDSHCGWPSFFDCLDKEKILFEEDRAHGMVRVEIMCKACGSHLGHVFPDGPEPTGERYCVNSLSLDFRPTK